MIFPRFYYIVNMRMFQLLAVVPRTRDLLDSKRKSIFVYYHEPTRTGKR